MAYIRQDFVDQLLDIDGNVVREGTTLKAEHLKHIEDGIVQLFEDRVCYDESVDYLEGVEEPLEVIKVDVDTSMYKMLDTPLTKEDLVGSVYYSDATGDTLSVEITEAEVFEEGSVVYVQDNIIVSVLSDCEHNGVSYTTGLWALYIPETIHVTKLVDPTIKQVEEKFIPDSVKVPNVTTTDNGKHMEVVKGAWKAVKPTNTLPTVTTADNNKFLQVVNGKWSAVAIQNVAEEGL